MSNFFGGGATPFGARARTCSESVGIRPAVKLIEQLGVGGMPHPSAGDRWRTGQADALGDAWNRPLS